MTISLLPCQHQMDLLQLFTNEPVSIFQFLSNIQRSVDTLSSLEQKRTNGPQTLWGTPVAGSEIYPQQHTKERI